MNQNNKAKNIFIALFGLLILLMSNLSKAGLDEGINALQQKEYDQAIKEFMKVKDNDVVNFWIAEYYSGDYGNQKNEKEAFKWMTRAVKKGLITAHEKLGDYYAQGFGTKPDMKKAFYYRKIAAENQNYRAMTYVGGALLDGVGTKRDVEAGKDWLEKAVAGNDLLAHRFLGSELSYGENFPKDEKRAELLLSRAWNEGGDYYSAYLLGSIYARYGPLNDFKKAFDLFKTAAEKGNNSDAMLRLGIMYREGNYVSKDWSAAESYFKQARSLDNKQAQRFIDEINSLKDKESARLQEAQKAKENMLDSQYKIGSEVCNSGSGYTEEYSGYIVSGKPYFKKIQGNIIIRAYVERREKDTMQLRASSINLVAPDSRIIKLNETTTDWGTLSPNSIFWTNYNDWKPCLRL
jgi:TPR repeat protein